MQERRGAVAARWSLALAALLAAQGIRPRIIDRNSPLSADAPGVRRRLRAGDRLPDAPIAAG